jgi:hypothetical protein
VYAGVVVVVAVVVVFTASVGSWPCAHSDIPVGHDCAAAPTTSGAYDAQTIAGLRMQGPVVPYLQSDSLHSNSVVGVEVAVVSAVEVTVEVPVVTFVSVCVEVTELVIVVNAHTSNPNGHCSSTAGSANGLHRPSMNGCLHGPAVRNLHIYFGHSALVPTVNVRDVVVTVVAVVEPGFPRKQRDIPNGHCSCVASSNPAHTLDDKRTHGPTLPPAQ